MKKLPLKKITTLLFISIAFCTAAISQTVFKSKTTDIRLNGTSSIHDWEMKAEKGNGEATILVDGSGKITSFTTMSFTLPAKSLKSDHTLMDNNTYKALKTDKNPDISFVMLSGSITATGGNNYQLNCLGKLTIAGTTKQTNLLATGKYNPADKSFTVTGVKKMKMTDYNVKPPTVMMGAIKTGDDISISYNVKFGG